MAVHIHTPLSPAFLQVAGPVQRPVQCSTSNATWQRRERRKMPFHMVALGKLMLLAGGGHSHWKLLLSLFCPFALKLPFSVVCFPSSGAELLLFLFRLCRIFLDETPSEAAQHRRGRLERVVRLLHESSLAGGNFAISGPPRTNEETFTAISMLAL